MTSFKWHVDVKEYWRTLRFGIVRDDPYSEYMEDRGRKKRLPQL